MKATSTSSTSPSPLTFTTFYRGYRLGDTYAETIHEALNEMQEVQMLDISKNRVTDEGVKTILKGRQQQADRTYYQDDHNAKDEP
jgi:hypothetical protein